MSFYSRKELQKIGFESFGENVLISRKSSLYNAKMISIKSNVRIDDYCILSAGENGIEIGNYVHIASYASLIGNGKIIIKDYCGVSGRVSIYSSNDDYSGAFLTNPTVPDEFTNVSQGDVILNKHVLVGAGSIVLPNVILEEGVAIGAHSLVNRNCKSFHIYAGNPAKKILPRSKDLLQLEQQLLQSVKEKTKP